MSQPNPVAGNPAIAIPVIEKCSREAFEACFRVQEPRVLGGLADSWDLDKWSPERLAEVVGDEEVRVCDCPDGTVFDVDAAEGASYRLVKLRFAEFVGSIAADATHPRYLQSAIVGTQPDFTDLPALREQLDVPDVIEGESLVISKLFLGTGGHQTNLHYDPVHNLLLQVRGRKRVVLFSPADTKHLYQTPSFVGSFPASPIDVRAPDLAKYPRYRRAHAWVGEIEPGQTLFIPAFWWHDVESLGTNVALNYWWWKVNAAVVRSLGWVATSQLQHLRWRSLPGLVKQLKTLRELRAA